jgi:hypothetical protein
MKPPNWCKNAIATNRGWVDPKTGEVLVSVKGLKVESIKEESKPMLVEPVIEKIEESKPMLVEPVIEKIESKTEILTEDKPKRKRRKNNETMDK